MNIRLLKEVEKAILERPENFDMNSWFVTQFAIGRPTTYCGTAACIAGWTVAVSMKVEPSAARELSVYPRTQAELYLDLTGEQAVRLFMPQGWPRQFWEPYVEASQEKRFKEAAEIAVARIEHFINTEGKE